MGATEYLEGIKKDLKLTYQDLADKTHTTPQYWHLVFRRGEPVGVEVAKRLIKSLDLDSEGEILLNLIFRERFLRFLERINMAKPPPTAIVRQLIKAVKTWNPKKGESLKL